MDEYLGEITQTHCGFARVRDAKIMLYTLNSQYSLCTRFLDACESCENFMRYYLIEKRVGFKMKTPAIEYAIKNLSEKTILSIVRTILPGCKNVECSLSGSDEEYMYAHFSIQCRNVDGLITFDRRFDKRNVYEYNYFSIIGSRKMCEDLLRAKNFTQTSDRWWIYDKF